jgi:hypothetical protein
MATGTAHQVWISILGNAAYAGLALVLGWLVAWFVSGGEGQPEMTRWDWVYITFFSAFGFLTLLWGVVLVIPRVRTLWREIRIGSERPVPEREQSENQYTETRLRLSCSGDSRSPQQLSMANVYRWFVLNMCLKDAKGVVPDAVIASLLIIYSRPTNIGQLVVSSPDAQLPDHEIKDQSSRHALIAFSGFLPKGELEIRSLRPWSG